MSHKNFSGSITVDADVYTVTGVLAKRGKRITGSLVFDDDADRVVQVNFLVNDDGDSFTTSTDFWFIDPDAHAVRVDALQVADTTIDVGFTALDIVDAPILLDGGASTLDMNIDEVVAAADVGAENEGQEIAVGTRVSIKPLRINEMGNYFDHFSGVLSVVRLPEETNASLLERTVRAASRPSDSTYLGVIRGTNRGLGLEEVDAIEVTLKETPVDDEQSVRLFINEEKIYLYRRWVPILEQEAGVTPEVEMAMDLKGTTIGKIVDWINTSDNYEATLLSNSEADGSFLMLGDSRELTQEVVIGQEIMDLEKENVLRGSLGFPALDALTAEVDINVVANPQSAGEYTVDYSAGRITAFSAPRDNFVATYVVNRKKFRVQYSPVKLTSVASEGAQDLYFNQVTREFFTNEENHYVNGLPTNETYGIMRKILKAGRFPQFWGE